MTNMYENEIQYYTDKQKNFEEIISQFDVMYLSDRAFS